VTTGITRSHALAGAPVSAGQDMNVLVMGLDSRLDEQGNPLPQEIYNQLHAGDDSVGGYNSNVLIVLHIPGDGSRATALSIPRDDYVQLYGCGYSPCPKGKIKEAYGRAYIEQKQKLLDEGYKDGTVTLEQASREAGRKAEIETVRAFLGGSHGIPIDHFVEVTLVAFFQIAQVVAPITVCVNENTSDSYSGARFRKGPQQIDARQAVAFVRQRRDPNEDLMFTDLDRDRRQQAFLLALSHKLQETGTLTNVGELQGIFDVAKQNIAIDQTPDMGLLARVAGRLTGGNITFYTLPVDHFGQVDDGSGNMSDVNIVDLDTIRAIVKRYFQPAPATPATTPSSVSTTVPAADGVVLNVVNSADVNGLAGQLETALSQRGFTRGSATSGGEHSASRIEYGTGAQQAAQQLGSMLSVNTTQPDENLPAGTVRLTVGSDFTPPADLIPQSAASDDDSSTTAVTVPTPVSATATGADAPAPTDLTSLSSAGVPCVK
jgi:LCP family protein required for cell wall assembly